MTNDCFFFPLFLFLISFLTVCVSGAYLFEGRCLTSCPDAIHAANGSVLAGEPIDVCLPCHYSCVSCTGASDSECTSCHADAQLMSGYCRPKELVNQLEGYERWALGIELALALNVAILVALLAYLFCSSKSCARNNNRSDRAPIGAGERRRLNTSGSTADYRHLISVHQDASLKSPGSGSKVYMDSSSSRTAVITDDEDDELEQ